MDYKEYIKSELLILVPVLYCIGSGLKKSKIKDKWIPLVLGAAGVLLASIWVLATSSVDNVQDIASALFTSVTQGVLSAGASVYCNQIFLQSKKE